MSPSGARSRSCGNVVDTKLAGLRKKARSLSTNVSDGPLREIYGPPLGADTPQRYAYHIWKNVEGRWCAAFPHERERAPEGDI